MIIARNENRRKWGVALVVTILLLGISLFVTAASLSISDWFYLYFCWSDILLFSALIIMFLGVLSGGDLPNTERWWEGAGWGLLMGISAYLLMASMPSSYSDYTDQMYNLACFGTMMGLFAFALGAAMRRYSILLLASFSFYFWVTLFQNEVAIIVFTVASLVVAGAFLYWLNKTFPQKKSESAYPKIEDILNDPEMIRVTISKGKGVASWSDIPNDPDKAMTMLELMALEQSNTFTEDDLPEWLIDIDKPKREKFPEDPLPKVKYEEDNMLNQSSPALFAIFVVLLIGVLFFLTFVAVFMR